MPLLALLFVVVLAPPFGTAQATAVSAEGGLVLELRVEVAANPEVVLARGVGLRGELSPLALSVIAPGEWGGIMTLDAAENISLAFEAIYPDGTVIISEPHTLTQLGVDAAVFGAPPPPALTTTTTTADVRFNADTVPWLIAAVVAGLAALLLLAAWTLAGRSPVGDSAGTTDDLEDADDEDASVAGPGDASGRAG